MAIQSGIRIAVFLLKTQPLAPSPYSIQCEKPRRREEKTASRNRESPFRDHEVRLIKQNRREPSHPLFFLPKRSISIADGFGVPQRNRQGLPRSRRTLRRSAAGIKE